MTEAALMNGINEFVRVGRVKDAHGLKGEHYITLFAGEAAWLSQLKEIRLVTELLVKEENGADATGDRVLVYPVKSARLHKNGLIVLSPGIQGRTAAEGLKGRFLEVPADFLVSEKGEALYLREVQGFKVFTKHKGEVGIIEGFSSNGAQDLLIIHAEGGEFEVPFVEAFVEKIDFESREMHLDLPEGLLGELEGDEVQ